MVTNKEILIEIDEVDGVRLYNLEGYQDWCTGEELIERLNKID